MDRFLRRLYHAGYLLPASLTGYLWLKGFHPHLPGWGCPFLAITGIPCPGCFLTRATSAALTGRFAESIELHLFGPITAAMLLGWSLTSIRSKRLMPTRHQLPMLAIAASSLFSYWVLRILLSYGLHIQGFPGFPIT